MRIAILYANDQIYVEFPPEVFTKLLTTYVEKYQSVEKAMAKITEELKAQTLYK